MPRDVKQHAETLWSDMIVEDGIVHIRRIDTGRTAYLEYLNELRKNKDALNHLSFAGWELSIPEVDLLMWKEILPDLDSDDRETRLRCWKWFMKSEHSDPFRVRERKRGILTT